MLITANNLRNILCILPEIERAEVTAAGYRMEDWSWMEFQDNPIRRFLRCNDQCRNAILTAVRLRMLAQPEQLEPTVMLMAIATKQFYCNTGDDADDPMLFALRAALHSLATVPNLSTLVTVVPNPPASHAL